MATLAHPLPSRDHRDGDTVEAAVGRRWRSQPATVHGWMYGPRAVNLLTADIARELGQRGDLARQQRFLAPIYEAAECMGPDVPDDVAEIRARQADEAVNLAETVYHLNPTPYTVARRIEAIHRERATKLVLLRKLNARRHGPVPKPV